MTPKPGEQVICWHYGLFGSLQVGQHLIGGRIVTGQEMNVNFIGAWGEKIDQFLTVAAAIPEIRKSSDGDGLPLRCPMPDGHIDCPGQWRASVSLVDRVNILLA